MKTLKDLPGIISHYQALWKKIRAQHPQARGSLHFAWQGNFVPIEAKIPDILSKNPGVFADSEQKKMALRRFASVLSQIERESSIQSKNQMSDALELELNEILGEAPLLPDCRIEIIWSELDFEIIKSLQSDPLVDRNLTPQTAASIRIVLGRIGD